MQDEQMIGMDESRPPLESTELGLTCDLMELDTEHAICRMPVTDGVRSATGVVHAGALLWLADLAATYLAREGTMVGPDGSGFPLAIDLHASLLTNQAGGYVTADARVVRRGRRVTVVRTRLIGTDEQVLAEVTTTHIPR